MEGVPRRSAGPGACDFGFQAGGFGPRTCWDRNRDDLEKVLIVKAWNL